jgi:hypothetical protein
MNNLYIRFIKLSEIDFETKISGIIADIVNCIIFIFLLVFYCSGTSGSGSLIPVFGSLVCLSLMVHSYIKKSILLYTIYLIMSALFYLTLSMYVILYDLASGDVPDHVIYTLLFKMNIPTMIMGFSIVMNAIEIEKGIMAEIEKEIVIDETTT